MRIAWLGFGIRDESPYDTRLQLINFSFVLKRCTRFGVFFIIKLVIGEMYSAVLLKVLNITIPSRASRPYVLVKLSDSTITCMVVPLLP